MAADDTLDLVDARLFARLHRVRACAAGDEVEEVAQDLDAVHSEVNLRVELNAVQFLLVVSQS